MPFRVQIRLGLMQKSTYLFSKCFLLLAEREGFEPSAANMTAAVFETAPFVHSGTSPRAGIIAFEAKNEGDDLI